MTTLSPRSRSALANATDRGGAPLSDKVFLSYFWSLVTGGQRLLPTGMLYFARDGEPASACVRADSNGNAAGSSLEDAVQHGFLELVERDAVAVRALKNAHVDLPGLRLDIATYLERDAA